MPPARSAGEEPLRRVERFRTVFWFLLLGSWVLAVVYMWEAMSTIPSAERLEQTRLVEIPGPRRFFSAATFSLMELTVVLAALWPWRPAYYGTRLAVLTWFIMTTPMDLSRMDWVHRRWLAWLVLAQVVALVVLLIHRLVRGVRDRRTPPH
jgi:hypothetical protein